MMKAIRITVLSILCICLVGFMIVFIKSGFNFSNMKAKLVLDKEYELNQIETISFDVTSADINIYESENDKIQVKFYSDEDDKLLINENEKELSFENKQKHNICFGFCFSSRKINIYVPKNYTGEFVVKATSGDITSSLTSYNNYKINLTSGDIKIDKVASLVGSATSGDIEIEQINKHIDFKTTSGDIDIDIFEVNENSSIKVTSGDIEINKLTNAYVDASAKSGDIEVNKNERHAPYELRIESTSGDIEVN